MQLYKSIRKHLLRRLTKSQKKQLKNWIDDIADEMINAYAEAVRLKAKPMGSVTSYLPIKDTEMDMIISVRIEDYKK